MPCQLQRYGFRASIADGGVNGLAALDTATFDLMIVDIFMPHMRGFESVRRFLTASSTSAYSRQSRIESMLPR
ncbi:MAG: response regulator [Bradyrhizobium sp.]